MLIAILAGVALCVLGVVVVVGVCLAKARTGSAGGKAKGGAIAYVGAAPSRLDNYDASTAVQQQEQQKEQPPPGFADLEKISSISAPSVSAPMEDLGRIEEGEVDKGEVEYL